MFQNVDIAFLGASSVSKKTGVLLWEPVVPITNDSEDVESLGQTPVYQALGFASLPFPKTKDGYADCIILRHCGGRDVVCLGGRDTRTAAIVGNMKPGDTVVHSTGPNQSAQLQLKEEKRQSVLVSKTKSGKTMALILDGETEKVQLTHKGALFEIDEQGDVSVLNASGCGFLIQGEDVHVIGTMRAGKAAPGPFTHFMLGPITGSPGGPASVPLAPCQGMAPG